MTSRFSAVSSPIFQIAIVDVDTGLTVATATSRAGDAPAVLDSSGVVDCTFESLPLRPRQYALRLAITDAHQLVSYDVVAAGPRFAVAASGEHDNPSDEGDGFVSLPYRFDHRMRVSS